MKRIFFMLVVTLVILPLQAATIYTNTERNDVYIVVNPSQQYGDQERGIDYGWYGIRRGLGPNTGNTVTEYYKVPHTPGHRSEKYINNAGSGAHGPGTY